MKFMTLSVATDIKTCFKCNQEYSFENFHKHKGMADGRLNKCKYCVVKEVAAWRITNPEARKKEHEKLRERKGGRTRQEYFQERFPSPIGRPASSLKYSHKRRVCTEQIPQTELDEFVFEEAYRLSKTREQATGIKWHIDHIVPILHKQACGLHNAFNLQVVPSSWNIKKGNRNMNTYAGY